MKDKIVLIGPVYPYKGGISHYTGLMYRALAKKFDVEMISYKMQYPKLLFKKEQRDLGRGDGKRKGPEAGARESPAGNCMAVIDGHEC